MDTSMSPAVALEGAAKAAAQERYRQRRKWSPPQRRRRPSDSPPSTPTPCSPDNRYAGTTNITHTNTLSGTSNRICNSRQSLYSGPWNVGRVQSDGYLGSEVADATVHSSLQVFHKSSSLDKN